MLKPAFLPGFSRSRHGCIAVRAKILLRLYPYTSPSKEAGKPFDQDGSPPTEGCNAFIMVENLNIEDEGRIVVKKKLLFPGTCS
jgi:hypothetical protein